MPLTPPRDSARPRRRTLLAGAVCAVGAGGLTGGCSGDGAASDREQSEGARQLRRTAARDSKALIARYDATAAAHPDLAGRLKPLRGEVVRHVGELTGERDRTPARSGKAQSGKAESGKKEAGGGSAKNRDGVPADRGRALADLAAAARRTADAHTRALTGAPPELARLLASVAASGAAHAYLLTGKES